MLHAVDHKSISRKHLIIQVLEVQPRDGVRRPFNFARLVADTLQTRTHVRTQVRVTDLGSSRGTTVDGEDIKGQERMLDGDEHTIRLGLCPDTLRCVAPELDRSLG